MSSFPSNCLSRRYSLAEIRSATKNFSENLVIGKGGFGSVYLGTFEVHGEKVYAAIKRLDSSSNQGEPEFWSEVQMLSELRHCNLVSLIGYCNDDSEMILLYEYMTHGSLSDHLHKRDRKLDWVERLKISIGGARGLQYLHSGASTQHGVIHRDVKSSNILLDEQFSAKISDFGLSKIGPRNASGTYVNTHIKGTFGYFDPEYFLTGRLTPKSDVFAFGVVLFELLSGRMALAESLDEDNCSLAKWAHECVEQKRPNQIVDPNIERQIFPKCLKVFVDIAYRCLQYDSKKRPTMGEIVAALELAQSLQVNHVKRVGLFTFIKSRKWLFILSFAQRVEKFSRNNEDAIECSPSLKEGGIDDHYKVIPLGEILDHLHQVSAQITTISLDEDTINHHASFPKEHSNDHLKVSPIGKIQILVQDLKAYKFSELRNATRNFSPFMRLGAGEFGEVFSGWVNTKIAVKRLYHYKIQHEKFVDLTVLSGFNHPNLVKLLGYCFHDQKLFLIYEFIENGSLDSHLFTEDKEPLTWTTRVKIAIGIAEGLGYLRRTQNQVDNRPLRLRNILLDMELNAKLSDFEASKLVHGDSTMVKIADPLYFHPQRMTSQVKGNIHAFGVILVQILTGQHISKIDFQVLRQTLHLKEHSKENFRKALDPRLPNVDDNTVKQAAKLAALAFLCLDKPSYTLNEALDVIRQL